MALNVAKGTETTVAVFSLEMSKEQLVMRLLSAEALVENNRLRTGDLRETDWEKIADAATVLNRVDIRIDDNPLLSVADMNAKCRRLENLGLVVIDYLQLMTSAGGKGYGGENRQQVVSDISRTLKIMSQGRSYSEQIAAQIDEEVRRIIASAYNQCEEILRARRPQLESVANYLLAHETMNRSEFLTVVDVPAPAQA